MAGFDAAAVSPGRACSLLPAQVHTPTAVEESPVCSMLLVAGSHLRRWLANVKMVSTYVSWPYVLSALVEPCMWCLHLYMGCTSSS